MGQSKTHFQVCLFYLKSDELLSCVLKTEHKEQIQLEVSAAQIHSAGFVCGFFYCFPYV